jgi:hypothetical protein
MPTFQKLGPQSGEVAFLKTLRGLGHVGRRAAHRSHRTHDAHACAGVGGRERLFVGALAHAGGDRQPVLVRRRCEREGALAIVARTWGLRTARLLTRAN